MPAHQQIPRPLLQSSYQHLLLALVALLPLAWTDVPAAGVVLVCATQSWRLLAMRKGASQTAAPNPAALAHAALYFSRAQFTLLNLGSALVAGVALSWGLGLEEGLPALQLLLTTGALVSLVGVFRGYRILVKETATW